MAEKAPDRVLGFPVRKKLFPGEERYFKAHPEVAGMASDDNAIIHNPYSKLSAQERMSVATNEAYRLQMRQSNYKPDFPISVNQRKQFLGTPYANNDSALRQTIVARILSGDPSASATEEQRLAARSYAQLQKEAGRGDNLMTKPVTPKLTAAQLERKRVDDFMQARLMERRMAQVQQPQQASNPNSSGLMNLINILIGRSPIQQTPWSKKLE